MAYFRKRGKAWQVEIKRLGFKPQSASFPKKADAEVWAKGIEADMDRGIFIDRSEAERMTFADLVDRFVGEFAEHHYRPRLDKKEAWRFQCAILKDRLGIFSLATLDQKSIVTYRDRRVSEVSASTARKELFLLSKILWFCETELGIPLPRGNPTSKVRMPADGKPRDRRLSTKEWECMEVECKHSRNPYLWPAVELAVETAMRQGELLGLKWSDIDLSRKMAMTRETKNGEDRAVPLMKRAVEIIQSVRSFQEKNDQEEEYVFPVERLTLYHVFVGARKRAKIDDFTFHDLRHEALSRMAERGDMSMLDLSAFSGHKTLQMLKRYTHLQAEDLATRLDANTKSKEI
jgi:integrase